MKGISFEKWMVGALCFFAMKTAVTLFFLKLKLGWVGASPPWCKLSGGVFCVLFIQIDTHRVH